MRGILACSIGLRDYGPGISNMRIAEEVTRLAWEEEGDVLIASQWEVTDALQVFGEYIGVDLDIPIQESGKYLSGDDLVRVATAFFEKHGVTEVIVVTHWNLAIKIKMLLKRAGFTVLKRKVGWIPCDRKSIQWWTRSQLLLFLYAVLQVLFHYQGKYVEPRGGYKVRFAE